MNVSEINIHEKINRAVLLIRGKKVILDNDLADIYGVLTKRINESVKRNTSRFPSELMFQLNQSEKNEVIKDYPHLNKIKHSGYLPYVFTEEGALMLACILNTETTIKVNKQIIYAFVKLRELLLNSPDVSEETSLWEENYDKQFLFACQSIQKLIDTPIKDIQKQQGFIIRQIG